MRAVFFLSFLALLLPVQNPASSEDDPPVVVVSSRWARTKLTVEQANSPYVPPAAAMISANKVAERERRANAPAGTRDPNADTIDGRSAALDKNVQDSRAAKPLEGFVYRVKVHNASTKPIEILFWEYEFIDRSNSTAITRRQFLCGVQIKSQKDKDVEAFSASGPSDVISVETLSKKSADAFEEKVVINRVEYADGSIWQRQGWHLNDVKPGYDRALATPWGAEMCRGL